MGQVISSATPPAAVAGGQSQSAAAANAPSPVEVEKRGILQMHAGDLAAAEASFRDAIARDPAIASFHAHLARCLARMQRPSDAIVEAEQTTHLAPDDPSSHALLGEVLLQAGRAADSEAALCRSLALRDREVGVLYLLSIALDRQGRYAEAATAAERVAALAPDNPDFHSRAASLCSMAGDHAGMERAFRAAIALRPDNLSFRQSLITALDRQGREDDLLAELRAAMALGPDDAGLLDQFGSLMMARERWADAADAFRKVAAQRPDDFGLFHRLGIVLERQGKLDAAIDAAERASELAPENDGMISRLAVMNLSARRFPKAEQALRCLRRLRPDDAKVHHMLAVALERQGRFAEALDAAVAARAIDPGDRGLQGHVVSLQSKCSRGQPAAPKTYLIFVATGVGLGHLMGAVLGSAFYAWETGRVFCMDMREVLYFKNDPHNAFLEHFRLVVPDGLEVITDLGAIERIRQEPDLYYLPLTTALEIERPFPNKVVLVPCITPGDPFGPAVRRADAPFRIELKGRLAEALARSMARPEWSRHVIGLHYRASVGELYDRMSKMNVPDYEQRYAVVKDNYVAQVMRLAERRDPASFACFVASDDRSFVTEMLSRLPNAFAFDSQRMDQYFQAQVLASQHDISFLVDAVTDLWALSRCAQLVYTRSAFTHFAIMNSAHLDDSNTFYIHMPMFDEIIDSVAPETAVEWARAAVRKIDVRRMLFDRMHNSLARALRRAGRDAEAALYARRAQWLFEAAHAPAVATAETSSRRGADDNAFAVQRARRAIAAMPGNPYFRGGYHASLSTRLVRQGDVRAAVAAARDAVTIDPLDAFLQDHLGCLLVMAGDAEAAEACFQAALRIAPDVAAFHANLSACAARRGAMSSAMAAARRAAELDPGDAGHAARCEALQLVQRVTMLAG